MAIYRRTSNIRPISTITLAEHLSNQVVLSGTNPSLITNSDKGFVLIHSMEVDTGDTITITDGNGVAMLTGIAGYRAYFVPILCEKGVTITGDVLNAICSVFEGI